MDYEGIKIPNKIILVSRKESKAAYVVDENNMDMLEHAKEWAGEGYNIDTFDNGCFKFQLFDTAHNSSQGGKLSFWNCKISVDANHEFIIGINSMLLLDILQNETFEKGVCKSKVYLGRVKGNQVGVFTESMKSFQQAKNDEQMRNEMKSATTKYNIGDEVRTLKETYIYLGVIYGMASERNWLSDYSQVDFYDQPKPLHAFAVKNYEDEWEFCDYNLHTKKPKRLLTGKHYDNITLESLYNSKLNEYLKKFKNAKEFHTLINSFYTIRDNLLRFSLNDDMIETKKKIQDITNKFQEKRDKFNQENREKKK